MPFRITPPGGDAMTDEWRNLDSVQGGGGRMARYNPAMNLAARCLALLLAVFVPALAEATESALRQVGQFPEQGIDSDHDGVADIDDNCPATERATLVRGQQKLTVVDVCGCPVDPCAADADKDGINDCDDLCPATARGLKVGAGGCPLPQSRPQTFTLDVKFKFAEATLQDQYVPDLDQVRALLLRLPELTVTLEGHTDAKGADGYNQALSQARARKCRKYLLSDPRIAPERVQAVGHGESKPIASNTDEAGRASNRRTVATLNYRYEFVPPNSGEALPP